MVINIIVIAFIHTVITLRYVFVMPVIGNLSVNKRATQSQNETFDLIINRTQTKLYNQVLELAISVNLPVIVFAIFDVC